MLKRLLTITLTLSALLTMSILVLARRSTISTMPIAYEVSLRGNWEIIVMDAARGLTVNLTQHGAWDSSPTWSPDGQQVMFLSNRDGPIGLFVMDAVGGPVRKVIDSSESNFEAMRWADDSRFITYNTRSAGSIIRHRVDTLTGQTELLNDDFVGSDLLLEQAEGQTLSLPLSSRQGNTTAFLRYRDGSWGIYVARSSLADARLLVRGRAYTDSPPSLSPDAQHVLYVSTQDGHRNVYLLNLSCLEDGNCQNAARRLTNSTIWKGRPIWLPA